MWSAEMDGAQPTGSNGNAIPPDSEAVAQLQEIIDEMRLQDFDSIRFATYRAACKLRFIQKKTNAHLVDIWNMIDSFRENGLNALPIYTQLKASRVELLLTSIFHNLNKRLVSSQHIDTDKSISLLLSFLLGAYDKQSTGRLSIFSIKIALATICAGKLVDKLRYMFSQISDSNGLMEHDRFADLLQQALALTTAVFEAPTFGFSEAAVAQCFAKDSKVTLNHFLDVFMSDPCPPCIMWLPLLHRMAAVEHVYHPVVCDGCQVRSFTGFRYKCQRCANYQLCQNCFWRGRTSHSHSNEHEMKEYSSYKSPTKQLAHSIQKSLQCIPASPAKQTNKIVQMPMERPTRPLELTNIVPATPTTLRRHQSERAPSWPSSPVLLPGQIAVNGHLDDEHKLIARYSAKLSGRTEFPLSARLPSDRAPLDERSLIAQLEEENSQMAREMARLENQFVTEDGQLTGLRERKSQLEEKMFVMQQRRRDLMMQLEQLMAQLNTPGTRVPPLASASLSQLPESLSGVGSKISGAFRGSSVPTAATLQGDLLHAADAITDNMSTLVRELDCAHESAYINGTDREGT